MIDNIWISVNAYLPDFDEFVIWYTRSGNFFIDHIDKDMRIDWWIRDLEITHWRKLPEPPGLNNDSEN